MSSLESIRTMLIDFLNEFSQSDSVSITNEFIPRLYYAFYRLITDPTQSPKSILDLIDTFTSGLDGFSTNTTLQSMVAFACFDGLVVRKPEVLNESWETFAWLIVKYSFPISSFITNLPFTSPKVNTLEFITEYCSTELCPNPCLRLELLRFIRVFNCNISSIDRDSFREEIINTICESSEKYISFNIDQVPKVQPSDLEYVMRHFEINMRYITDKYDYQFRHSKIIPAFLRISRKFALLGMETKENFDNPENDHAIWIDGIEKNMIACSTFCGILPDYSQTLEKECLEDMIHAGGNDFDIQNYVIDILDTISEIANTSLDISDFQDDLGYRREKLYDGFSKVHVKQYPFFQYLFEMDGGPDQAEKYRLRHFQENVTGEYFDSDSDSKSISSDSSNMNDHNYTSSDSESEKSSDNGGLMQ